MRPVAVLVVVVALAACGGGTAEDAVGDATIVTATVGNTTTSIAADDENDWDKVVGDAVGDVQAYWRDTYPAVYGAAWQDVAGGLWPYTSASEPPPCGTPPPSYAAIAENVFYCPTADLVAWDSETFVPFLFDEFGVLALGLVVAHEIGHAVQARAGVEAPATVLEQQADCFAGAWTAHAGETVQLFDVAVNLFGPSLAGFLQLADSPASVSRDEGAHGSAFDRVAAVEDGFRNGAAKCATYPATPPPTVPLPFAVGATSAAELDFGQVEPLVVSDLETFWATVFPSVFGVDWTPVSDVKPYDPSDGPACGGQSFEEADYEDAAFYCVPDDYVAWDETSLMPGLYEDVGDFAQAEVIATQYSLAARARRDAGTSSRVVADCFTGAWMASLVPGSRASIGLPESLTISPHDLQEAVTAFIGFNRVPGEDVDSNEPATGDAFERVASFRTGFLNGITACS